MKWTKGQRVQIWCREPAHRKPDKLSATGVVTGVGAKAVVVTVARTGYAVRDRTLRFSLDGERLAQFAGGEDYITPAPDQPEVPDA